MIASLWMVPDHDDWPRPISQGVVNLTPLALVPGGLPSGMEIAGRAALFGGTGSAKRTEHAVQRGVADAKPVFLADEMMTQMILLDPATEPRSRPVWNMRDVMHPFIMQDRQHHSEQRRGRGLDSKRQREQPGSKGEVRHQKPDRQK